MDVEKDELERRNQELDRFWDIDALIPGKRAIHYAKDTETTEIVIEPPATRESQPAERSVSQAIPIPKPETRPTPRFVPPHTAEEQMQRPSPDEEYTPDNVLIRRVRLYRWKSNYRYYEGFVRDAMRLVSVKGQSCARVPFFSYVPQYGQMSRAQLEWYLWWRENFQNGICLETDYSYVLLYAYELINLSGRLDAEQSQSFLCRLWAHYRETYRQLDSYLPEWICDYGLIHRLPPPKQVSESLLSVVMSHCNLKEYYVPSGGEDGYLRALLAFCSNYDYHKSKFCTEERAKDFDRIVTETLRAVTRHFSRDGQLFSSAGMDDSKMVRDAFTGALCSYRVKRRIEVEFCSFSRSHELRYFITDVVKYTENKLRAAWGIRSRLSVYALSTSIRELIDGIVEQCMPTRVITVVRKEPCFDQTYEKLYELPKTELSLAKAAEIERLSWETTERLVEAFEENAEPSTASSALLMPSFPAQEENEAQDDDDTLRNALGLYKDLLQAVYERDVAGQINAARRVGKPLEVLVDEVNSLAAEHMGDILIEEEEERYTVIEEYEDILGRILDR